MLLEATAWTRSRVCQQIIATRVVLLAQVVNMSFALIIAGVCATVAIVVKLIQVSIVSGCVAGMAGG